MNIHFRIADTSTHLNGDEHKAVKTTAFDLQLNPPSFRGRPAQP
ncbi:MAG: hypothetical protein AB7I68_12395 [Porticoccaceae bacterium]